MGFVFLGFVGAAATIVASVAFDMPAGDALRLASIAGGAALVTGLIGMAMLYALRRRAIGVQLTVVALATVASVGMGAIAAAEAMFISRHDVVTDAQGHHEFTDSYDEFLRLREKYQG